jgi:hypothetical protein
MGHALGMGERRRTASEDASADNALILSRVELTYVGLGEQFVDHVQLPSVPCLVQGGT